MRCWSLSITCIASSIIIFSLAFANKVDDVARIDFSKVLLPANEVETQSELEVRNNISDSKILEILYPQLELSGTRLQQKANRESKGQPFLRAAFHEGKLWPLNPTSGFYEIPFAISVKFTVLEVDRINSAMSAIEANTLIRFIDRTNQRDYVIIYAGNSGCASVTGRLGKEQPIMLQSGEVNGKNCLDHGNIIHELMHTIGLGHEHQRIDRDNYLQLYQENIPQKLRKDFAIDPSLKLVTSFDYASIMLYDRFTFSSNKNQVYDPKSADPNHIIRIVDAEKVTGSSCDWYLINKIYPSPKTKRGDQLDFTCNPHQLPRGCRATSACQTTECDSLCLYACHSGVKMGRCEILLHSVFSKAYLWSTSVFSLCLIFLIHFSANL